jgi:hypothetical protein
MSGPNDKRQAANTQDDWERVLSAAAHLQEFIPDAVLVGGTAAAMHAEHRFSYDADHVVPNLVERYQTVLESLESQAGWETNRIKPPVLILGNLDGVDTGIRNLIRSEPLETERYQSKDGPIVLPTLDEMARIKAWLVLTRNATRDYIDFVALADKIEQKDGLGGVGKALLPMDRLYPQKNGSSPVLQLAKQLAEPKPKDLGSGDISAYKLLAERWKNWETVKEAAKRYGVDILYRFKNNRLGT